MGVRSGRVGVLLLGIPSLAVVGAVRGVELVSVRANRAVPAETILRNWDFETVRGDVLTSA